jgi:hypothetical protein
MSGAYSVLYRVSIWNPGLNLMSPTSFALTVELAAEILIFNNLI